jgi:hypothetical protein
MFCPRRRRLPTVLAALACLLFMQLAVAGYSCPGTTAKVQQASAMAQTGVPCAGEMSMAADDDQLALCHAHCAAGPQASDNQPPQLPAAAPIAGLVFEPAQVCISSAGAGAPQAPLLARATPPPLAIRNCCWRI